MGMFGMFKSVGSTVLHSNQPIKKVSQTIRDSWRNTMDARIKGNEGLANSLDYKVSKGKNPALMRDGKRTKATDADRLKTMYKNDDGSWNKAAIGGTIAGGFMGVSAAGRVATGGGLYRDSDGNFDLIGIPFI